MKMKALFRSLSSSHHFSLAKSPAVVKITFLSLLSLSLFFPLRYFFSDPTTNFPSSFSNLTTATVTINTTTNVTNPSQPSVSPPPLPSVSPPPLPTVSPPPRPPGDFLERTGIIDENGSMALDFIVGDYDSTLLETEVKSGGGACSDEIRGFEKGKTGKFGVCDESMSEYNNVEAILKLNSSERGKVRGHCPEKWKGLDCVVPIPEGYRFRGPWPKKPR